MGKLKYFIIALIAAGVSTYADYCAVNAGWSFTMVMAAIFFSSLLIDYILASWGRGK